MMSKPAESVNEVKEVRGYCALCTAHCAMVATVKNGRVTRLDSDRNHPNGGVICIKGKAAPELVYHPERLDYPLKRTRPKGDPDPGWQRISWDEALDDTATAMRRIAAESGPEAVAFAITTSSGTAISDAQPWVDRLVNAF